MSAVVPDSSAALALVLPDERSEAIAAYLSDHQESAVRVPCLWWYECTNVLLTATRRGRIEASDAYSALTALRRIPAGTDPVPTPADTVHWFHLGVAYRITAYDAAYLSTATLHGAALLTLDERLSQAAAEVGVEVVDI
jgi:predicted nucleic acid-binding protein